MCEYCAEEVRTVHISYSPEHLKQEASLLFPFQEKFIFEIAIIDAIRGGRAVAQVAIQYCPWCGRKLDNKEVLIKEIETEETNGKNN